MNCPKCDHPCERDMVDVGVGEIPCGPWGCPNCFWCEDDEWSAFTPDEAKGE